jgi:transposase
MYLLRKGDVFMDPTKRKTYSRDFKRRTVDLADKSERPDSAIEKEMGLYQGAIGAWRKELKTNAANAFPGKGNLKPDEEELRKLRRELEIVREERDILKKAVAIFSHGRKSDTRS